MSKPALFLQQLQKKQHIQGFIQALVSFFFFLHLFLRLSCWVHIIVVLLW